MVLRILCVAAALGTNWFSEPLSAAEIVAWIGGVNGAKVALTLDGDFEPREGDKFRVMVEVAGGEAQLAVGTVTVVRAGDSYDGRIDEALGRVQIGQKVRINSPAPVRRVVNPFPLTAPSPAPTAPAVEPIVPRSTDPRDTRFPPRTEIVPGQVWIGESRWYANQREVVLCGVLADGPAGKAGLRTDDTILSIGGAPIRSLGDFHKAIDAGRPGETVTFEIERGGQKQNVLVTYEAIPPDGGNGRILAAAEAGAGWAMMDIGVRYSGGRGKYSYFDKNDAEAVRWFRRATEAGYTAGPLFLGQCYYLGRGVERDYAQAAQWFEQARSAKGEGVRKGLLGSASVTLAAMHMNGLGVPKNPARAVQIYREAIDAGSLMATHKLGQMYETGQEVPQDLSRALELFQAAGTQSYGPAEYSIARMLYEGRGVERNNDAAMEWFTAAAEHGSPDAMYMLGTLYEKGEIAPRDPTRAAEWYGKAAAAGHAEAKKRSP